MTRMRCYLAGCLAVVTIGVLSVNGQSGNLLTNGDLTRGDYRGWVLDPVLVKAGQVEVDSSTRPPSIRLEPNAQNTNKDKPLGLGQMLPVSGLIKKSVTVRGAMKSSGAAGLILAFVLDARGKTVANVVLQQLDRSEDFRLQKQTLAVPSNAARIVFGIVTPSTSGKIWFSELYIGLEDSSPVPQPIAFARGAGAEITVNASHVLRPIPRSMFGTNVEWVRNANSLWDEYAEAPRPEFVSLARQLGISVVRYPGGGYADYYHWRNGIGSPRERNVINHYLDTGKSAAIFGTQELMAFTRSLGAEPLLQVNVVTGTAKEAAEWVAYCNQPHNAERARDGSVKPFPVHKWEIGNEQYIKPDGSLPLPGDSYMSPGRYVARFKEYASAMRAVDPILLLGAIGGRNFGHYRLMQDENWDEVILTQAADQIDFLSIHNAYAPLLITNPKKVDFDDAYRAMFAFPPQIAENLREVNEDLEQFGGPNASRIKIAVTEWGPLFGFDVSSPFIDHVKTLGSALYVASLFQVFLRAERVDLLTFFKFTDRSFMGWVNGIDAEPKPVFYALQMYSRHFGEKLVESKADGPAFSASQAGLSMAQAGVPYLDAVASLNGDGSRLYLIVVNKHFTGGIPASIRLNGFRPADKAKSWTLTGPSLDANNGSDMHGQAPQAAAPANGMIDRGHPGEVRPIAAEVTDISKSFTYTFVPRSVTALEFSRAQ